MVLRFRHHFLSCWQNYISNKQGLCQNCKWSLGFGISSYHADRITLVIRKVCVKTQHRFAEAPQKPYWLWMICLTPRKWDGTCKADCSPVLKRFVSNLYIINWLHNGGRLIKLSFHHAFVLSLILIIVDLYFTFFLCVDTAVLCRHNYRSVFIN